MYQLEFVNVWPDPARRASQISSGRAGPAQVQPLDTTDACFKSKSCNDYNYSLLNMTFVIHLNEPDIQDYDS